MNTSSIDERIVSKTNYDQNSRPEQKISDFCSHETNENSPELSQLWIYLDQIGYVGIV